MSDDPLDYEAIGSELMKVSYWSIYSVSLVKTLLLPGIRAGAGETEEDSKMRQDDKTRRWDYR